MKKKIQALCASLFMGILLFMAGVQTFAGPSYTSKFSDWGNLLKQYANDENGNEMIYARGKNGVITPFFPLAYIISFPFSSFAYCLSKFPQSENLDV